MKTAGGGREITLFVTVGAMVAVAVVAGIAMRGRRSPPEASAPALSRSLLPGIRVDAAMPPAPGGGTDGDRRIEELGREGKSRLLSGDSGAALATWRQIPDVQGVADRGALYYVRLLEAHGFHDETMDFLNTKVPPKPSIEFYGASIDIYLRNLQFREAHHCFGEIARLTGDPWSAKATECCLRLGWDPRDVGALRELAAHYTTEDARRDLAVPLLERICALDSADAESRDALAHLGGLKGGGR